MYFSLRMKPFLAALLIILSYLSHAQIPDSLRRDYNQFIDVLESDLPHEVAADSAWNMQSWQWKDATKDERGAAIELIETRLSTAKAVLEKARLRNLLRHIYQYSGSLGKAVVQYEKLIALHSVNNDSTEVVKYYYWMAQMYHTDQLYEESIIAMNQLRDYQKEMAINGTYINNIWTLGYYYTVAGWELNKPSYQDSAVKYLGQTYDYAKTFGEDVHVEWTITYAMGLARNGKKRKAIAIATDGLRTSTKTNNLLYLARFHKQISQYYLSLEMKDSAFYHIYESAKFEDEYYSKDDPNLIPLQNHEGRLHAYNMDFLIQILSFFDEEEAAIDYLRKAIQNRVENNDLAGAMYYRQSGARLYHKVGDYEQAALNYQLYTDYQDSVHNAGLDKASEVKAAQLESQISIEKERAAKEKRQLDELAQKEKENLRTVIYSVGSGSIITASFLIVVYRRFRITTKQKKEIESQKGIIQTAYEQLGAKNKEILDSIAYAKRIQSAILPPKQVIKEHLPNTFVVYIPKDIVAGDFYWLEPKDDKVLFAAADCTGHGVPGAMVSVVCNNGLNRSVREHNITEPGKILGKTKEIVMAEFEKSEEEVNDGMDIALCTLSKTADAKGERELQYAGAHNPLWIIREGTNEIEEYKANKQPIGKFFHEEEFKTHTIKVKEGDMLYMFSDGFADQFGGERGKKYYAANFQKFLLSIKDQPLPQQKRSIIEEYERWKGELDQLDDICVIGVRL